MSIWGLFQGAGSAHILLGQRDSSPTAAGVTPACWLWKGGAMPSQMSGHIGNLRTQVTARSLLR